MKPLVHLTLVGVLCALSGVTCGQGVNAVASFTDEFKPYDVHLYQRRVPQKEATRE